MKYSNPVMAGFHPDPSVIRVGTDYYAVNSTFQYFPGVVISHSTDLVHWKTIGHALTRGDWLDMSCLEDSRGFWAPDISYYNGLFYIFVTLRLNEKRPDGSDAPLIRRQMIVTAEHPAGPWSKPSFIDVDGIDPSHFVDDDGKHYMLLNPAVTLVPLNDECTAAAGEPVKIWEGSGGRIPEGPHMFKKDGYYHLITAEGGTGYAHQIGSGRSCSLYGPFEVNPHSPLMIQRDVDALIQRTGHGKFVCTQYGEWWVMYLCGRPFRVENTGLEAQKFCTLGRETALDPVSWTDDGWPVINEGRGPSSTQDAPNLPSAPCLYNPKDDFDSASLALDWYMPRGIDDSFFSLTARPGFLTLTCRSAGLNQLQARPVVRREQWFVSSAECCMDFSAGSVGEEAGMTLYYDMKTHIKFCRVFTAQGAVLRVSENRGGAYAVKAEVVEKGLGAAQTKLHTMPAQESAIGQQQLSAVFLRIDTDGLKRSFSWSYNGSDWNILAVIDDAWFLSDEGCSAPGLKRFTGCMTGMYAWNGGSCTCGTASFDYFSYRGGEGGAE